MGFSLKKIAGKKLSGIVSTKNLVTVIPYAGLVTTKGRAELAKGPYAKILTGMVSSYTGGASGSVMGGAGAAGESGGGFDYAGMLSSALGGSPEPQAPPPVDTNTQDRLAFFRPAEPPMQSRRPAWLMPLTIFGSLAAAVLTIWLVVKK